MDRGAWWATVHGAAKSQTQLKQLGMQACTVLWKTESCFQEAGTRGWIWEVVTRGAAEEASVVSRGQDPSKAEKPQAAQKQIPHFCTGFPL